MTKTFTFSRTTRIIRKYLITISVVTFIAHFAKKEEMHHITNDIFLYMILPFLSIFIFLSIIDVLAFIKKYIRSGIFHAILKSTINLFLSIGLVSCFVVILHGNMNDYNFTNLFFTVYHRIEGFFTLSEQVYSENKSYLELFSFHFSISDEIIDQILSSIFIFAVAIFIVAFAIFTIVVAPVLFSSEGEDKTRIVPSIPLTEEESRIVLDALSKYSVREIQALFIYLPLPARPQDADAVKAIEILEIRNALGPLSWNREVRSVPEVFRKAYPDLFTSNPHSFRVYRVAEPELHELLETGQPASRRNS